MSGEAKRVYKDSVFRFYFREKENFISLAEAVTGVKFDPSLAEENTVEGVVFDKFRNDVSYTIGDVSFIFFEHQSTLNENMALRLLFYLCTLYSAIVPKDLIYRAKRIMIPAPRFFVFYNGKEAFPERMTMKLSDSFYPGVKADIELAVEIYNINYRTNPEIIRQCRPMHDYSYFVDQVEGNIERGMDRTSAVKTAMERCVKEDVMRDFFEKHGWEVFDMVSLKWNEEEARRFERNEGREEGLREGIEKGIEKGLERGRIEGREEGIANMIRKLLSVQTPIEYIRQATGLSEEDIRAFGMA